MNRVLLGVTGSISAYKAADIVRLLKKEGIDVQVVQTPDSLRFVSPVTFEALSGHKVIVDPWEDVDHSRVEHIALGREFDLLLVAPASLDLIGRCASGLADTFLSLLYFAFPHKILFAPAMNSHMFLHPATQENIGKLRSRGASMIMGEAGALACGETGLGRLAEPQQIVKRVKELLETPSLEGPLQGVKVVVTAGPTREKIDAFRFISNPSSGKTGYLLARRARELGAQVVLISGPVSLPAPEGTERISIESAQELEEALKANIPGCRFLLMSAAVSDFRPQKPFQGKIEKESFSGSLALTPNPDILKELSGIKEDGQVFIGFSAEDGMNRERARKKMDAKGLDGIILNSITAPGLGFGSDMNSAVLLFPDGGERETGAVTKEELSALVWEELLRRWPR